MSDQEKTKRRDFLFTASYTLGAVGVPERIHVLVNNKLKIPMINNKRSLNIASSVAIILAENLRQNKFFNNV